MKPIGGFTMTIKELRQKNGLSQMRLAQLVGVHQTAISQWEKGRTAPDRNSLIRLAEIFEVSVDSLISDNGADDKNLIPVLGFIRAGMPVEAVENIIGYEKIGKSADKSRYFALRIVGDSMMPRFCQGDTVIVRQQNDADTGDIVVAFVGENDATIKKLIKKDSGIVLMPLNSEFEPMMFSNEEVHDLPVSIIGKVTELRARF